MWYSFRKESVAEQSIDFRLGSLRNNPDGLFLPGFDDAEAKRVAFYIVRWAREAGLMFRSGSGATVPTEYVVVPPNSTAPDVVGIPILTLEQRRASGPAAKGHLDFPTWRWRGTALADGPIRHELARRMNAIVPHAKQLTAEDFGVRGEHRYWQNVEYNDVAGNLDTFVQVLNYLRASVQAVA